MTLQQKPDESNFDYQKRLVYGKLVDKTLADMDYLSHIACNHGCLSQGVSGGLPASPCEMGLHYFATAGRWLPLCG